MSTRTLKSVALLVFATTSLPAATSWTVLGWTEFGVNPMERSYSVFALYPPSVTIHAQVIDATGKLIKTPTGLQVTYEALADPSGSINSTSVGKTDFFSFSKLFGGTNTPDTGLTGNPMPGSTPRAMQFDSSFNRFTASAVPLTPYDDNWNTNYYPLFRIVVRDSAGSVVGSSRVAVPVSNEVECRNCHASGSNDAARPTTGWVNDPNPNNDFKLNILSIHDIKNRRNPLTAGMLASAGYSADGLLATAQAGTSVRCDICHASNRLGSAGQSGALALTSAMHGHHAPLTDPKTNDALDNSTNRTACYNCHPGSNTHGLRGAMGHSVASDGSTQIQCQSCHGNLSALADPARRGYVDLPNCQACHTTALPRQTSALDASGKLRTVSDTTFATTSNGLFSTSVGHGGLQCSACHGPTHGENPSGVANENLQSADTQGASGVIGDCTACHKNGVSSTNGGPHGMHNVGINWVSQHQSIARNSTPCQTCHSSTYQGSVLSRATVNRSLSTDVGVINMFPGFQVGCYTCHNGPGGNGRAAASAILSNLNANATTGQSATIAVTVPSGATLRVVRQPVNGSAKVSGNTLVYQSENNFEGTDQITFAALSSAAKDSTLGTANVRVTSTTRPVINAGGVSNAASYGTSVAPGTIALIQGKGLGPAALQTFELNSGGFIEKAIGQAKVLFDGVAAPILYTWDTAVAAIVPYSVAGKSTTSMSVQYNGIASAPIQVPVAATAPGIFTADSSGSGNAAAVNQDGTLNSTSNPAPRGSIITLYLTGDGVESPLPPDGKLSTAPYPATTAQVAVTVGGKAAQVAYAGAAPTAVAGLMQVNITIPTDAATGAVPVVVSCDGVSSQGGLVIQVK